MKSPLSRIDPLRVVVFILMILPLLALLGFGLFWLWQSGNLLYWLLALALCGGVGYGLQQWLLRRERRLLADAAAEPNPDWPPSADAVWQQVEALAEACDPADWPLDQSAWMLELGQQTLETVAHCYHPEVEKPLLELTLPHTLMIIERASRDLRQDVAEKIPFSNRLTIGDLFRIQRWKEKAEQLFNIYRAGNVIINPVNALLSEVWRHLRDRSFDQARNELHRWFLRAYVYKVGYYAIDLYSGRLPLGDEDSMISPTAASQTDVEHAHDAASAAVEPLRILVLGRTNAGKSSLINALFGQLKTSADVLPDTTQGFSPFVLTREGLDQALIFDSPGCDSPLFDQTDMLKAASRADFIIWVSPANRPDRQRERECLDALRTFQAKRINFRSPPLVVAVSFIDQLRPINEWKPPYDLRDSTNVKSTHINAVVRAVAADLAVPVEYVIPVCLQEGKTYNVEDALWAAILNHQDQALKVRLMRCLDEKKRREDWMLLQRQVMSAGRFLWNLSDRVGQRSDHSSN